MMITAYLDAIGDDEWLRKRSMAVILMQAAHKCGGKTKDSGTVSSWLLHSEKMKSKHQNNIKATVNPLDDRPYGVLHAFKLQLTRCAPLSTLLETLKPVCTPMHVPQHKAQSHARSCARRWSCRASC